MASQDSSFWYKPMSSALSSSELFSESSSDESEGKSSQSQSFGSEPTELDALTNVDPGTCASLTKINASIEAECHASTEVECQDTLNASELKGLTESTKTQ